MFIWKDGPDRFYVSTSNYFCIGKDELLNDIIVNFYLRFVFANLSSPLKDKCYVFSSMLYTSLTKTVANKSLAKSFFFNC